MISSLAIATIAVVVLGIIWLLLRGIEGLTAWWAGDDDDAD